MRYEFHQVLFEYRQNAIECLTKHGIIWFQDYSSIDCHHECFGIEITGIKEEDTAKQIIQLLKDCFKDLIHHKFHYDDSSRENSWIVVMTKVEDVRKDNDNDDNSATDS